MYDSGGGETDRTGRIGLLPAEMSGMRCGRLKAEGEGDAKVLQEVTAEVGVGRGDPRGDPNEEESTG